MCDVGRRTLGSRPFSTSFHFCGSRSFLFLDRGFKQKKKSEEGKMPGTLPLPSGSFRCWRSAGRRQLFTSEELTFIWL